MPRQGGATCRGVETRSELTCTADWQSDMGVQGFGPVHLAGKHKTETHVARVCTLLLFIIRFVSRPVPKTKECHTLPQLPVVSGPYTELIAYRSIFP